MNIDPGSVANAANKITYGGAATAFWGTLSASDLAAFGGLALAAAGFMVNLYFRRKDERRNEAFHRARMARLDDVE